MGVQYTSTVVIYCIYLLQLFCYLDNKHAHRHIITFLK